MFRGPLRREPPALRDFESVRGGADRRRRVHRADLDAHLRLPGPLVAGPDDVRERVGPDEPGVRPVAERPVRPDEGLAVGGLTGEKELRGRVLVAGQPVVELQEVRGREVERQRPPRIGGRHPQADDPVAADGQLVDDDVQVRRVEALVATDAKEVACGAVRPRVEALGEWSRRVAEGQLRRVVPAERDVDLPAVEGEFRPCDAPPVVDHRLAARGVDAVLHGPAGGVDGLARDDAQRVRLRGDAGEKLPGLTDFAGDRRGRPASAAGPGEDLHGSSLDTSTPCRFGGRTDAASADSRPGRGTGRFRRPRPGRAVQEPI